ncbi:GNAT family N-acetyltransferase [Undibacter mobilis]|uniref:N-acetyltransferase n=1 Tax=Undibacter mobilis TaxID=2292256 RepID=A0A371BAP2_9BRAD|nr:GNAT family N-acetyltransferase [Undibacter mobilis]RDV04431.1 N-acetyltransferase [Undibacter mobilis]
MSAIVIREIGAAEAERRIAELGAILRDAVDGGASVNFLAGLTQAEAEAFWRGQLAGLADGSRHLLVADDGEKLVGTVVLTLAPQPNQPHRADVGKMLVLSSLRRQGLGCRLLEAVEALARAKGRTLLMLDTTTGSSGDRLYRCRGWVEYGIVPAHALSTLGIPTATSFFYKQM